MIDRFWVTRDKDGTISIFPEDTHPTLVAGQWRSPYENEETFSRTAGAHLTFATPFVRFIAEGLRKGHRRLVQFDLNKVSSDTR